MDLLPQVRQPQILHYKTIMRGLLLILWGMFLKVILADRLGVFDSVYNDVHSYSGWPLIMATYLYALQIYFDFHGYSEIAVGLALLFNIQLTKNFNRPYLANSVSRILAALAYFVLTLDLRLRFKPLQMQMRGWKNVGSAIALIITFFISGIWHGVSWGYIIWGVYHGLLMAVSVFTIPMERKWLKKHKLSNSLAVKVIRIFVTFHLVCFGWIFFRANNAADGVYIVSHLFSGLFSQELTPAFRFISQNLFLGQPIQNVIIIFGLLLIIGFASAFKEKLNEAIDNQFLGFVWKMRRMYSIQVVVIAILFVILGISIFTTHSRTFIYSVSLI